MKPTKKRQHWPRRKPVSKDYSSNDCRSYARQSVEIRRLATTATTYSGACLSKDAVRIGNEAQAGRRGLTLLELILALSLSILVVYAIGMAIHLNLRVLEARRSGIEKAQLARAILQLVANDLRSAVQYETLDFSSVNDLAGAEAMEALGDAEDLLEGGSLEEISEEDLSEEEEPLTSTGGEVVSSTTPGLIGYQYELHVDVSRLPRPDQYDAALTSSSLSSSTGFVATDIPSDVKTVSYYLQNPDQTAATGGQLAEGATEMLTGTGLIRRELDRAVTSYAMEMGDMTWLQQSGKVVAPEVVHIEFLYFDGVEWLTEWDSEALQSLPLAVDIRMILQMDEQQIPGLLSPQLQAQPVGNESFYRMVVHLPVADPKSEEELLELQTEEEEEETQANPM